MADFTIVIPLLCILSKPSFILVSWKICSVMCLSYSLVPDFYNRELKVYILWFLNKGHTFYWDMHLQNSEILSVTDKRIMLMCFY